LYRHPLVDINNINVPGQRICSHFLVQIPRADAEIVTNKLPLIYNKLISTTTHGSVKIISTKWFMHISHLISVSIFLENFDTFFFVWSFSVMRFWRHCSGKRICSHFLVQIPRADAEIVTNKLPLIFFLINMLFLYLNVNKKFWLQFIYNKLISTTTHGSVKIISTKWFMHISHLISVSIFLENFDTFFFVWSFSPWWANYIVCQICSLSFTSIHWVVI
jgi:hypothetical protein